MSENLPTLPVADIFKKGLALFQDPSRWAQGYYQYDKDGNKCPWAEGYSFCALGALVYFGNGDCHKAMCCLQRVSEYMYGESIQVVNDKPGGYDEVIKAYEFAIRLWDGREEPTTEELGMSVEELLRRRNG